LNQIVPFADAGLFQSKLIKGATCIKAMHLESLLSRVSSGPLKTWIDRIARGAVAFGYDEEGQPRFLPVSAPYAPTTDRSRSGRRGSPCASRGSKGGAQGHT
jgi:hypothetical protein